MANLIVEAKILKRPEVTHFFSTAAAGNLSYYVGDDPANVTANRQRLTKTLNLSNLTTAQQVHGSQLVIVTQGMGGRGSHDHESAIPETDALITNLPDVCLMVQVADCVPILLYDPIKRVIAAVHAGWRGTVANIAGKTVGAMRQAFGSSPADIIAAIGPSIGACCFEVGEEVRLAAVKLPSSLLKDNHFDLWGANDYWLKEAGVNKVETSRLCTSCNNDQFFSYRKSGGKTGRSGAGIMLK
ncbi:MAG: peptidoglycan editing factor PgeF [Candidatus Margulisiibacteriota bacterium]